MLNMQNDEQASNSVSSFDVNLCSVSGLTMRHVLLVSVWCEMMQPGGLLLATIVALKM